MSRISVRTSLVCAVAIALVAMPSSAAAETYCVGAGACAVGEGATVANLAAAFAAADNPTADIIKIGPGTHEISSYLSSDNNEPLTVVGAGRGVTTLHISDGGGPKGISLADENSSISNLDIDNDYVADTNSVPISIFSNTPDTGPQIHDIGIRGDGFRAIDVRGYVLVRRVDVRLRSTSDGGKYSIALSRQSHTSTPAALTQVYDSYFEAAIGVSTREAGTFEMQRSKVRFFWMGVTASAAGYLVDVEHDVHLASNVFEYVASPDFAVGVKGIEAQASSNDTEDSDLDLFIWDSTFIAISPLYVGIAANSFAALGNVADTFVNANGLMFYGDVNFEGTSYEDNGAGAGTTNSFAQFTLTRSTTPRLKSETGGFVDIGGISQLADPKFVDAAGGDYRLQWNSPLVDAGQGDPGQMPSWLSTTDFAGALRPVWSTGSAAAQPKTDIGAFEYNRAVPVVTASASTSAPLPGGALTLTGNATDANPGEGSTLTYAWTLPGGATATTQSVNITAPTTPGSYQATFVATDVTGAASLPATVTFTVPVPVPATVPPADTAAPKVTFSKVTASLAGLLKRKPVVVKFSLDERATVSSQLTASLVLPALKKGKPVRKYTVVLAANKAAVLDAGARSVKFTPTVLSLKTFNKLRQVKGAKVTAYRVVLVATDAAKNTAKPTLAVKVTR